MKVPDNPCHAGSIAAFYGRWIGNEASVEPNLEMLDSVEIRLAMTGRDVEPAGRVSRAFRPNPAEIVPVAAVLRFAVVSLLIVSPLQRVIDPANGQTVWAYLALAAALLAAGGIYFGSAYLLRVPEFHQLLRTLRRRFAR